ncbi:MAG: RNA polymerase sigma factor [Bacteroidota bacterium]
MENPFSRTNYNDLTDIHLIESALTGDKLSLNHLLQRHQNYIYNVALKMLNNIADAEDVTQEILIKIVTQLSKYDKTKAQFRTWLYRITFNHILNLKKNQYETIVTDFSVFFNYIDDAAVIELSDYEEQEMRATIEESKIACMAGMIMCLKLITTSLRRYSKLLLTIFARSSPVRGKTFTNGCTTVVV